MISVQVRFGAKQRRRFKVADEQRADALRALAEGLRSRGIPPEVAATALQKAATCSPAELEEIRRMVSNYRAPKASKAAPTPKAKTFRDVGEAWTSGDLHRQFPDQVEEIFQESNAQRLEKAIYPVIGDKPVSAVTRADADAVMRALPEGLTRSTRRQYAGLVNRVLNLAELAGHIDRNPIPRGWLPKPSARKRFPILYPGEDRALLACVDVPLGYRVLYGFAHREGMRRGELAELRWHNVDLVNGTVSLDENKTDHARMWKLSEGVPEALARWRKVSAKAEPADRVFCEADGTAIDLEHLAEVVRQHLRAAGLIRTDLYSSGANKGPFGSHCFRRSFVTLSLAAGRSEDWVRQRTGHKSEELLTYRQASNALAELALGAVDALDLAIPELRPLEGGTEGGTAPSKLDEKRLASIENQTTSEDGGTGRRARFRF